ncbi:MAG TPA: hypothetical protein VN724_05880 [Pyrinomonadaceae bacterium]|jgi:hypothetical protein|nr:hypothetical protein [Pyrinomonadaceae bacterium]
MKRFLAISLVMLGLSVSLNAQEHSARPAASPSNTTPPATATDNSGWVKFASDNGHFSVLMPDTPQEKVETTDSSHGPYTTHLFIVRDTTSVYLIGWVDYDPSFNFNRQAELEANRDNFVNGIKAKLVTTRPTVVNGYSGLEFTAETEDRVFKSRVFLVGRRPYQIVIGSPKDMDDTAIVSKFFNSFKVSPN